MGVYSDGWRRSGRCTAMECDRIKGPMEAPGYFGVVEISNICNEYVDIVLGVYEGLPIFLNLRRHADLDIIPLDLVPRNAVRWTPQTNSFQLFNARLFCPVILHWMVPGARGVTKGAVNPPR